MDEFWTCGTDKLIISKLRDVSVDLNRSIKQKKRYIRSNKESMQLSRGYEKKIGDIFIELMEMRKISTECLLLGEIPLGTEAEISIKIKANTRTRITSIFDGGHFLPGRRFPHNFYLGPDFLSMALPPGIVDRIQSKRTDRAVESHRAEEEECISQVDTNFRNFLNFIHFAYHSEVFSLNWFIDGFSSHLRNFREWSNKRFSWSLTLQTYYDAIFKILYMKYIKKTICN